MGIEIDLRHKLVLVTGAAGRIGTIISRKCAECGADLILLDREILKDRLDELAQNLKSIYGNSCISFACDLQNIGDKYIREKVDNFNVIDVLVNCAGVNIIKSSLDITEKEWDDVVDINLKWNFFLTQLVARKAIKTDTELSIINIGSQHGVVGNIHRAPYCSSKGGIVILTKALAVEWAKYKIRVNCVSPSYVISEDNFQCLMNPNTKKDYLKNIPIGRYCEAEDVANTVVFLASSISSYITGENILVDGGYTAR